MKSSPYLSFCTLSNEDDLEDEDLMDENSKSGKSKESECASEIAEPSPGPSGSSETPLLGEGDEKNDEFDEKQPWPAINDLNTRLRRVITTYQRNYRKEEMKLAQKSKVRSFQYFFLDFTLFNSASCFLSFLLRRFLN